ncbi:hypothetical protein [Acetobacter indonesiensis]|uniref:Uncharacterized protein n=1 Tax=Acetobacter indonesiensis TaxID=104101 RepID=A0A252AKI8_9PROT|nr:hypothetical protein [Acetobacter indonesiensis]OUI89994.1 hypothetical protein HK17_14975 [Acetobacter indonesiensis]
MSKPDDTLDWHEWSDGSLPYGNGRNVPDGTVKLAENCDLSDSTNPLGGTPLHESEPGLMDEEILPLEADWWKGT